MHLKPYHHGLNVNNLAALYEQADAVYQTWLKRQVFRTETEMRVSVLDDIHFPTPAAKYWQCVREQSVQIEQLILQQFEFRRNELKIQQKEKSLEATEDALERGLLDIDLDELRFAQQSLRQQLNDRAREVRLWTKLMAELDDGSFDTHNADTHQLISYGQRFLRQLAMLGQNATQGEINNLIGQLQTTLQRAKATGVLEEIFVAVPEPMLQKIIPPEILVSLRND